MTWGDSHRRAVWVAAAASLVVTALVITGCSTGSTPTEQGVVVTEIRNDLGQPVWMAVCMARPATTRHGWGRD